jgi:chromosome segregation ATPase
MSDDFATKLRDIRDAIAKEELKSPKQYDYYTDEASGSIFLDEQYSAAVAKWESKMKELKDKEANFMQSREYVPDLEKELASVDKQIAELTLKSKALTAQIQAIYDNAAGGAKKPAAKKPAAKKPAAKKPAAKKPAAKKPAAKKPAAKKPAPKKPAAKNPVAKK